MCGIVGLFLKDKSLEADLGRMLSEMLVTMTDRGPDSAGIAVYNAQDTSGQSFQKCYQLCAYADRVKHIAPADYRKGSHLRNLLEGMVRETADRILARRREERDNATVAAPGF